MALRENLPHLSTVVDEMAILNAVTTDQFNHAPAQLLMHTGTARLGRPSLGSWVTYGLGSENKNLPAFVVLTSGGNNPDAGKSVAPFWLPDDNRILFASNMRGIEEMQKTGNHAAARNFDLFLINEDGTGLEQVTHLPGVRLVPDVLTGRALPGVRQQPPRRQAR